MLQEFLNKWAGQTLDYKQSDCARFVGDWAGVDFGEWDSPESGLELMRERYNCERSSDVMSVYFGEPLEPCHAKAGDIVSIDMPPLDPLGICLGRESVFLGETGLTRIRTRNCMHAWRKP